MACCRPCNLFKGRRVFGSLEEAKTYVLARCEELRKTWEANGHHLPVVPGRPLSKTVLGLFSDWECVTSEVALRTGDTLVIYTDGITEAPDTAGEEFGEARLIEAICSQRHLSTRQLVARVHAAVQQVSAGIQVDDLTRVIGRVS